MLYTPMDMKIVSATRHMLVLHSILIDEHGYWHDSRNEELSEAN